MMFLLLDAYPLPLRSGLGSRQRSPWLGVEEVVGNK